MRYPFPEIERYIYKKTFLKDVSIRIDFTLSENVDFKAVSDFFTQNFKLGDISKEDWEKGVGVESSNKLILFGFSSSSTKLKMCFPAYKDFSFTFEWIKYIESYLNMLSVTNIDSVSVSKFNRLDYSFPSEAKVGITQIMREIFSRDLLNWKEEDSQNTCFEDEEKLISSLSKWGKDLYFSEKSSNFRIEYGFSISSSDSNKGHLDLKTSVATTQENITLNEFHSILWNLNHILDRGFRWSVSENIINQMKGSND